MHRRVLFFAHLLIPFLNSLFWNSSRCPEGGATVLQGAAGRPQAHVRGRGQRGGEGVGKKCCFVYFLYMPRMAGHLLSQAACAPSMWVAPTDLVPFPFPFPASQMRVRQLAAWIIFVKPSLAGENPGYRSVPVLFWLHAWSLCPFGYGMHALNTSTPLSPPTIIRALGSEPSKLRRTSSTRGGRSRCRQNYPLIPNQEEKKENEKKAWGG